MVLSNAMSSTLPPVCMDGRANPIRRPRAADRRYRHCGLSTRAQAAVHMLRSGRTHLEARTMLAKPGPSCSHRVAVSAGREAVLGGLSTEMDLDHKPPGADANEASKWGESIHCAADRTTARSRSPQWERWV